jgi:Rrf2 family transcriptional regulator, nitric oxide-sensitive transcriptional repressor
MISQTAEYALRAIVYLAMNADSAFTTQQISVATKVPPAYLSKVMQALVRSNLVSSQRGHGGGFILEKKPEDINILEIISSVDPIHRIRTCPLGLETHGINLCALHKKIDDATAVIENTFAEATVADILAKPTASIPLCEGKSSCRPGNTNE